VQAKSNFSCLINMKFDSNSTTAHGEKRMNIFRILSLCVDFFTCEKNQETPVLIFLHVLQYSRIQHSSARGYSVFHNRIKNKDSRAFHILEVFNCYKLERIDLTTTYNLHY
jgi:hypothetical protein